jgi:uncharacterized protein (TIGR03000 family)
MYSVVLMAALTTGGTTPDWGWRNNGCNGGCYGGCQGIGWRRSHGCSGGCYGCYGGCYGSCYGGCYGGAVMSYSACYGCYGGTMWSCHGGCYGSYSPYHVMPRVPAETVPLPDEKKKKENGEKKKEESVGSRATLVVEVPADAKLFIDDQPMKASAAKRTFQTPPLQPGQLYYYMVRVEVTRDGQSKSETQRVIIRPGEQARAAFPNLEIPTTATAAR